MIMKNKTARIIGTFDCDLQTTTGHSHAGHVGQSGHTVCGEHMGHLVVDDAVTILIYKLLFLSFMKKKKYFYLFFEKLNILFCV